MPQLKRPFEPGTSSSAGKDASAAANADLSFDHMHDSDGESADEDPEKDLHGGLVTWVSVCVCMEGKAS